MTRLSPGSRVGPYEITAFLGAGGMGEVYRAQDAKLGRDVAVKILPASVATDAERLTRFDREARVLASLNHHNIAAIYGVEHHASSPALVLEFVDGDTLADVINRERLTIDRSLALAKQIADALDAAHERGIVHRDLKPANIKITPAGTVKVLDFGLAKALSLDLADTPTTAATVTVATQIGAVLGTAAYMSPEQARGAIVDKRTDIWAFGCVLFEMLAGRLPFDGATTSDMIAAILERAPDWSLLPAKTPSHVRRVITRCLEKDVRDRARDIGDVRAELDEGPPPAVTRVRSHRLRWLLAGATAVLTLVLIAVSLWRWRAMATMDPEPAEFVLSTPDGMSPQSASPSPNGDRIALVLTAEDGVRSIWVRRLDDAVPVRLNGTEGAFARTYWSRDGHHIAFVADGKLKRIAADGGPVLTICPIVGSLGVSWGADDVIVFTGANRSPLYRVPADGGQPEPITKLDPDRENSHRNPHFLPDGRHFLFTARSDARANNLISVASIDSTEIRPLFAAQSQAVYVEPGYLLFVQEGALLARPFDLKTLSVSGTAFPVLSAVRHNPESSSAVFSASTNGRILTWLPGDRSTGVLTWFDRSGKPLGMVGRETTAELLRLSPDVSRAVFTAVTPDHGTRDIWMVALDTGGLTRLTSHPSTDWSPAWSPDGTEIAFASDRNGLSTAFRLATDGSGRESMLYRGDGGVFPTDWTADGHVLMNGDAPAGQDDVLSVPASGGKPVFEVQTGFATQHARASRDGRFVAFQSNESGRQEIYVKLRGAPGRLRVSLDGGTAPLWRQDGRELFFSAPDSAVMAVDVTPGPPLKVGAPRRLFRPCERIELPSAGSPIRFDVTPDGSRVLAICSAGSNNLMTVRLNWATALQKKTD